MRMASIARFMPSFGSRAGAGVVNLVMGHRRLDMAIHRESRGQSRQDGHQQQDDDERDAAFRACVDDWCGHHVRLLTFTSELSVRVSGCPVVALIVRVRIVIRVSM